MDTLITNPIRYAKEFVAGVTKYAFGKGLVSLGVMAATFISGGTAAAAIWPVVAGFVAWKMYRLYDGYTTYKDRMLDLYRDEIGREIGIDPAAVTREHLRVAAHGDAVLGIEPNAIIAEALDRQRGWALLSFCTALLSAGTTLALLSFGMEGTVGQFISEIIPGELTRKASIAALSGLSGLIVHNGLDAVIGQSLGYFRATAHDRIALIARQKAYGVKVTPQQVFDVFLAANPEFAKQVSRSFNKGITGFTATEKKKAMQSIGVTEAMQELADQINKGELSPGTLAFELDSTHAAQALGRAGAVTYDRTPQQEKTQEAAVAEEPTTRFTDRVTSRAAHTSFVDAEQARRDAHAHRPHHSI